MRVSILTKKNIEARLTFVQKHLDGNQDFWENIKLKQQHKPIVKHSASMVVWGYFAASGPGHISITDRTLNCLPENPEGERPAISLCAPKHCIRSTSEWLKKAKVKDLEWPSQRLKFD